MGLVMSISEALAQVPIWAWFASTTVIVLLSIELGYQTSRFRLRHSLDEKEGPVATIDAATLELLALILAFTFQLAASRFDARRQVIVEEANCIGTAYLRAGLLPDGRGTKIRTFLRDYVDARLEGVR